MNLVTHYNMALLKFAGDSWLNTAEEHALSLLEEAEINILDRKDSLKKLELCSLQGWSQNNTAPEQAPTPRRTQGRACTALPIGPCSPSGVTARVFAALERGTYLDA